MQFHLLMNQQEWYEADTVVCVAEKDPIYHQITSIQIYIKKL